MASEHTGFATFIETGWSDHAERPREVADRLAARLDIVDADEHVAPFVRLAAHVYGEHLGEWERGIDLLRRVRASPACVGTASAMREVDRSIAMLRYAAGEGTALDALALDDRVAALAGAAAALAGRGDVDAGITAYTEALRAAGSGSLADGSPAVRALAVAGNNLAAALEELPTRSEGQTRAMVMAARGGLTWWQRAGTWLEHERAEYRLSRSLLLAGDTQAAADSARRCIEICHRNRAPAFEHFFGYAALAMACRAAGDLDAFTKAAQRARDLVEEIPADDRRWCEAELEALAR